MQHRLRNLFYFNQTASAILGVIHSDIELLDVLNNWGASASSSGKVCDTNFQLVGTSTTVNIVSVVKSTRVVAGSVQLPSALDSVVARCSVNSIRTRSERNRYISISC